MPAWPNCAAQASARCRSSPGNPATGGERPPDARGLPLTSGRCWLRGESTQRQRRTRRERARLHRVGRAGAVIAQQVDQFTLHARLSSHPAGADQRKRRAQRSRILTRPASRMTRATSTMFGGSPSCRTGFSHRHGLSEYGVLDPVVMRQIVLGAVISSNHAAEA